MLAYLFVVLAIAVRFLPHAWSFTPLGAALLFFGAKQPRKNMWIPVALLVATDIILTKYVHGFPLTLETFASSAYYILAILIGSLLKENIDLARVAAASLTGSVSFFVISNFAVWLVSGMYAHTLSGLAQCFTLALPFFRNTFIGDMVFAMAIFGTPMLISAMQRKKLGHLAA